MNSMIILYRALNNDQPMTAQKTQFETLSSGCRLYNLLAFRVARGKPKSPSKAPDALK